MREVSIRVMHRDDAPSLLQIRYQLSHVVYKWYAMTTFLPVGRGIKCCLKFQTSLVVIFFRNRSETNLFTLVDAVPYASRGLHVSISSSVNRRFSGWCLHKNFDRLWLCVTWQKVTIKQDFFLCRLNRAWQSEPRVLKTVISLNKPTLNAGIPCFQLVSMRAYSTYIWQLRIWVVDYRNVCWTFEQIGRCMCPYRFLTHSRKNQKKRIVSGISSCWSTQLNLIHNPYREKI